MPLRKPKSQQPGSTRTITRNQEKYTEVSTVRVDSRGRVTIAKVTPASITDITAYKQYQGEHGEILLVPVVEIPARELWLHQNQEAKESVVRGLKQSVGGQTSDMGDFSQYLED